MHKKANSNAFKASMQRSISLVTREAKVKTIHANGCQRCYSLTMVNISDLPEFCVLFFKTELMPRLGVSTEPENVCKHTFQVL